MSSVLLRCLWIVFSKGKREQEHPARGQSKQEIRVHVGENGRLSLQGPVNLGQRSVLCVCLTHAALRLQGVRETVQ